ncbi:MAG: hypothetical protein OSB46_08145 [Alphaproteobacteria bacterium]|nr:hypothetical protein [Alphaproteobacteria bacterium]
MIITGIMVCYLHEETTHYHQNGQITFNTHKQSANNQPSGYGGVGAEQGKICSIKFSLSVRVAEPPKRKDIAAIPIETLTPLVKSAGFQGVFIRAFVVSIDSPLKRVEYMRYLLESRDLPESMVIRNPALTISNTTATDAIRNVAAHLDLADRLRTSLVQVMLHNESDIAFTRLAVDEAKERGLKLC